MKILIEKLKKYKKNYERLRNLNKLETKKAQGLLEVSFNDSEADTSIAADKYSSFKYVNDGRNMIDDHEFDEESNYDENKNNTDL